MRTKTCKNILNHILNGGKFTDYKGDIVMADGTVLTYADWLGKNTGQGQTQRWVISNTTGNEFWNHPPYIYMYKDVYPSVLIYIFPFLNVMRTTTSKPSATSDLLYSHIINDNVKYRTTHQTTIFFGSGDTAESENDYALKNGLDNVTLLSFSFGTQFDKYVTLTIQNWNEEEVVVRELGAFAGLTASSYSPVDDGVSATNLIMLARLVLDNPVTIPANGSAQIYIK